MSYVPLQRTFQPLAENTSVADIPLWHRPLSSDIGWAELLRMKRAILSGAAGAGKTEEMQQRVRELVQQGKAAFFVSMRAVSKSGFAACLSHSAMLIGDVGPKLNELGSLATADSPIASNKRADTFPDMGATSPELKVTPAARSA